MIVLWRVTEKCNLSCPFCAYDKTLEWSRLEIEQAEVRRFGSVLSEYQRATGGRVLVSWIGGEPLLYKPLGQLTEFFTRNLNLAVSATTNGTTLTSSSVREHIVEHYAELSISVDTTGAAFDKLRRWRGGFEKLRNSVTQLVDLKARKGHGPKLRANIVLMSDTMPTFEALCLELSRWGIEEITFNQLGGRDRPGFFPAHRLRPADVDHLTSILPGIRKQLANFGVAVFGSDDYLVRIRSSTRDETISVTDCKPGEQFLFVSEDAIISPCNFTRSGYGIPLAEVVSAASLVELPKRFARLQRDQRQAACNNCLSTRVFSKFAA